MTHPERHLYGRRIGKPLRMQQATLVETLLPRLALDLAAPIENATLFPKKVRALRLEIGFGGGEHLVREAAAHPDVGFIGCEPFVNGVAKVLAVVAAQTLDNIRIHHGDARDVLVRLSRGSLSRVDLLYPDPWPKRRQRKRRFVSPETLALIAQALEPGGVLRFASDIDDYTGWTLAHAMRSPHLRWQASRPGDWRQPWPDWEATRYETKARAAGRDSAYLTFTRV